MRRAIALLVFTAISANILSGCAIADAFKRGFKKGMDKGKDDLVAEQMVEFERALQSYAVEHEGRYPAKIDDSFKSYYKGGHNYFSNQDEMPVNGRRPGLEALRKGKRPHIEPGVIEYSSLEDGKSFAIIGGAHDGKALTVSEDSDQVLVLPRPAPDDYDAPAQASRQRDEAKSTREADE